MLPEIALKHGAKVVILNKDNTLLDEQATAIIHEPLSQSMDKIYKLILKAEKGKK